MSGTIFQVYVEQALVPTLKPGNLVMMNNLPAAQKTMLRAKAERTGTTSGSLLLTFTPSECSSFFIAAGYEPD